MVRMLAFEQAFDTLPDSAQLALLVRYRDGHSIREVSKSLACSIPAAQHHIQNGRRLLADALDRRSLL